MRAADHILDLGPGHGALGGQLVFQGSFSQLLKSKTSLTAQYLSGRKMVEVPQRRVVEESTRTRSSSYPRRRTASNPLALNDIPFSVSNREASPWLKLSRASLHNLQDLAVDIPLGRFVCITGVSGSGKTTLVREVLLPALTEKLKSCPSDAKASDRFGAETNGDNEDTASSFSTSAFALLEGWENLESVVLVDQSILGKTPRSNPDVYIGAVDDIRELLAQSELAKQ